MTRLPTILACLALSACNPPHMWKQTRYVAVQSGPPVYGAPAVRVCHDKWGREITRSEFMRRDYQFVYGDHCYDVGQDPRPFAQKRSRRYVR